ncbi:hypothetical protein Barb7_02879 [Bacteroidales bacterium Barb7]|nr:hypothetical protein Barb7_02879 [Bacteroidales bacterium Barb7]
MPAYLRLVMQAAQGNTRIFAFQCLGNGFPQRGFTDSRRTVEADDGGFHIAFQLQYCQMFDDAFLDLFQAVMVMV